VTAETAYNERVARVENQIIARLRDRLGTARNANEMFRVFSKFNALFVRPKASSCYTCMIHHVLICVARFAEPSKSTKLNLSTPSKRTSSDFTIRYGVSTL
jgi:hypothetical protein